MFGKHRCGYCKQRKPYYHFVVGCYFCLACYAKLKTGKTTYGIAIDPSWFSGKQPLLGVSEMLSIEQADALVALQWDLI